jgi:serine/threonine protein kinase
MNVNPDYEILRELGRGGMGVVDLAHNRLMGRLEVLHTGSRDRQVPVPAISGFAWPEICPPPGPSERIGLDRARPERHSRRVEPRKSGPRSNHSFIRPKELVKFSLG